MDLPEPGFREQLGAKRWGLAREILGFLRETKKWWLTPIILAVLLLGILVTLGATGAAPFIYTLF